MPLRQKEQTKSFSRVRVIEIFVEHSKTSEDPWDVPNEQQVD